MEYGEFFRGLKGTSQELLFELDELRKQSGLGKLYLIYMDEKEVVWGSRRGENEVEYQLLAIALLKFIEKHTGLSYQTDQTRFTVFGYATDEIDFTLNKELVPYIESHGGHLEIVSVNEATGVIEVDLRGACETCPSSIITMRLGVKNVLVGLLPWIKDVVPVNSPSEPDFGVKQVLDETHKESPDKGGGK